MPAVATANPLPPGGLFVHVQPVNPSFCDECSFAYCEDLTQHTELTGLVEFDLFVYPLEFVWMMPDVAFYQLAAELHWPSDWQLVSLELCGGAVGSIDPTGPGTAHLEAAWPNCPLLSESQRVFLAARLVLDVTHAGTFGATFLEGRMGCPPDDFEIWLVDGFAQAGMECSYCYTDCYFEWLCEPQPDPTTLALEALAGDATGGQIHVLLLGWDPLYSCELNAEATADWLSCSLQQIDDDEYQIGLIADASGLEPGVYEAWVRAVSDCIGCTRVVFTVLAVQGLEEEPGADRLGISWGQLKTLYRN
jgi:hypothetical protein